MADSYTTDGVGAILMGIGGDNNTWGNNLNAQVVQVFADAMCNALVEPVTGGTLDLSGTPPPAAPSQARHSILAFAGVLTGNQTVIVPNLQKWWWVFNITTGAFTLTLQLPGAVSPILIPQTSGSGSGGFLVRCNGAGTLTLEALGTNNLIPGDGALALPAYTFVNEQNSGWRRAGTQDVRLVVNGADVLQVTGPGAANPSAVNLMSPQALQSAGAPVGFFTAGDVKLTFKTVADPGWIMMDDSTIGDGSSNATHASAANSALFGVLYNSLSDADAPILTSGGGATTRGAQGSAATAFANHCRLTLSLTLGRALAVAGSGAGLTSRALGHAVGEETHVLSVGELPAHTHNYSGTTGTESATHTHGWLGSTSNATFGSGGFAGAAAVTNNNTVAESAAHTHNYAGSTDAGTGGAGAHNNIEPRTHLNCMIKL